MTKPVFSASLPAGRVRIYYDGKPDAAFWRNLRLLCEQMIKGSMHVQTMAGVEFGFDNPEALGVIGVVAAKLIVQQQTGTFPTDAEIVKAVVATGDPVTDESLSDARRARREGGYED